MLFAAHFFLFQAKRPHWKLLWPLILIVDVTNAMRWTVIAIKYAYMTRAERMRILFGNHEEAMALNSSLQVLTSFATPEPALVFAEAERIALATNSLFTVDTRELAMPLNEGGCVRLQARLAYDLKRLNIDEKYHEQIIKLTFVRRSKAYKQFSSSNPPSEASSDAPPAEAVAAEPPPPASCKSSMMAVPASRKSVSSGFSAASDSQEWVRLSALLLLLRLAAQPIYTGLLSQFDWRSAIGSVIFMALAFAAPAMMDFPSGRRLVWLSPTCGCDVTCDPECFCSEAGLADWGVLTSLSLPFCFTTTVLINFLNLGVIESTRRLRSLDLWGKVLHCNGHPRVRWVDRSARATARASAKISSASAASYEDGHQTTTYSARSPASGESPANAEGMDAADPYELEAVVQELEEEEDDEDDEDEGGPYMGMDEHGRSLECLHPNDGTKQHPLFDITLPETYLGWFVGRSLLANYGARFHQRIETYMSCFLMSFLVLLVSVSVYLYSAPRGDANVQLVYATLFLLCCIVTPIIAQLVNLMNANWISTTDQFMLSRVGTGVRLRLARINRSLQRASRTNTAADALARDESLKRVAQLESCSALIEQTSAQLDADQRANPLRLLFVIPATYTVVAAGVGAAGAGLGFMFSFLFDVLSTQYDDFDNQVNTTSATFDASSCTAADAPVHEGALGVVAIACLALGFLLSAPSTLALSLSVASRLAFYRAVGRMLGSHQAAHVAEVPQRAVENTIIGSLSDLDSKVSGRALSVESAVSPRGAAKPSMRDDRPVSLDAQQPPSAQRSNSVNSARSGFI